MKEIILKELIKSGVASGLSYIKNWYSEYKKNKEVEIKVTQREAPECISEHLKYLVKWCSEITLVGESNIKGTDKYVNLDLNLSPRKWNITEKESDTINSRELLDVGSNLVILGEPGAGKSTTFKYMLTSINSRNENGIVKFPILIRLRLLEEGETVYSFIESILGIRFEYKMKEGLKEIRSEESRMLRKTRIRFINNLLEELKAVVFVDGLDEISPKKREIVIEELQSIGRNVSECKVFVSCRSGEYDITMETFRVFEIRPLSESQIRQFIYKWLDNDKEADELNKRIVDLPYFDTASKPLTLAHLTTIYEEYGVLPEKPKTVYKKIVHIYLEKWNSGRKIRRQSKYANFEPDRKFEFLTDMSFYLTTKLKTSSFNRTQLKIYYENVCDNFNLPRNEAISVVQEIESHNGIILQTGFDRIEFAHKTLQEYLTAEYIVKLPTLPTSILDSNLFFNELAIAVSLSSDSSYYFGLLLFEGRPKMDSGKGVSNAFIRRLVEEKPDFSLNVLNVIIFLYILERRVNSPILIDLFYLLRVPELFKGFLNYYRVQTIRKDYDWISFKLLSVPPTHPIKSIPEVIELERSKLPNEILEFLE